MSQIYSHKLYLWTEEGWLYHAVIIDLFSRKVVGWSIDSTMTAKLVCKALSQAVRHRGTDASTLCHFDRGSQYASDLFQALLRRYGFTCSISRKGNCWDNAVAESFFHSLKVEAIYGSTFRIKAEAKNEVFEWIECLYNTNRRHSTLGYISPAEFERRNAV